MLYVDFYFSIQKSKYQWVRTRISSCLLSPKMYCFAFARVVYFRVKAFGKKRENKTHRKISHSEVYDKNSKVIWFTFIFEKIYFLRDAL